jgi:RND family efflux transporter MFP subunit
MSMFLVPEPLSRTVRRRTTVLVALLSLGLMSACGGSSGPGAAGGAAGGRGGGGMALPVEMLTVAEKPVEQASEFVGTVRSLLRVNVQAQVEGFLRRVNVKSGDKVTPGVVMFEIDDASQLAIVANLESVRVARESDATFAKQQAERARRLLASGAISQQEHDQAQALQRSSEAQLKAVEEQVRQQKNELAYSRVTASTNGVVGDVPVRTGDRITRQTLLTTLEDNSSLELYLNVPVKDAPRLKLGQTVRIQDEGGAVVATERVTFISPSADDAMQTVLVKAPIASRGGAVRSDQFVRARLVWSTEPSLTVPLVAVTRISGQFFVFVAEAGQGGLVARQRPVVVGALVGNDYVVHSGLKTGDRVIVAGIQRIGDGAPVMDAKSAGPGAPKPAEPAKDGAK